MDETTRRPEVSQALFLNFPGLRFRVPVGTIKSPLQARLNDTIGSANTEALIKTYGGETIYIPRLANFVRASRNLAIVAEFDGGVSRTQLALKYRLSYRQIDYILQKRDLSQLEPTK